MLHNVGFSEGNITSLYGGGCKIFLSLAHLWHVAVYAFLLHERLSRGDQTQRQRLTSSALTSSKIPKGFVCERCRLDCEIFTPAAAGKVNAFGLLNLPPIHIVLNMSIEKRQHKI